MTKVLVCREESATSRTAPVARKALATVPLVREIEDMQTVPFSGDELATNHMVQTPRRARDRGPHPVENGGRGGRGAVARVWHEAVQGLVDTFITIGVQCPSWVFLYPIAVLPHFWPNFIKPGCSLNRCQSFSCSYMSVHNCGARESNPESRWWSFTIDFPTVSVFCSCNLSTCACVYRTKPM